MLDVLSFEHKLLNTFQIDYPVEKTLVAPWVGQKQRQDSTTREKTNNLSHQTLQFLKFNKTKIEIELL